MLPVHIDPMQKNKSVGTRSTGGDQASCRNGIHDRDNAQGTKHDIPDFTCFRMAGVINNPRTRCTPAGDAPRTRCTPPPQEMRGTPAPRAPITINEPSIEPSGNRQKAQAPFSTDLLIREGVPDDVARDFAELRKRLKAPISETAIKGLIREAQKAGMTLTEVLETVCANGWRGFKADWVAKGSGRKTETIAERNARIEREIFGQSLDDEARTIDMEKIA